MADRPTIPIEWCVGGRELTEPRLAPDGRSIGYVVGRDGEARLVVRSVDDSSAVGVAQVVTPDVAVRAGRGMGGGAWCWSPDGTAVVHAGVDGDLWWQPLDGRRARRLTRHGPDRSAQAPFVSADGRRVVYVVDQCEVWSASLGRGQAARARRLDDGSADFSFDPVVDPSSTVAAWHAWNVPDMPWDRSRVEHVALSGGAVETLVDTGFAVQQPRFAPDGELGCARDDSGWTNVWLGGRPLVDEPFEHAGPSWGLGQRSFAFDAAGARWAFTRNERGFGRLCVGNRATGRVDTVGRGVHGQLSWATDGAIDRIAAIRSGARTPTEIVVYELAEHAEPVRLTIDVASDVHWDRSLLTEPELVEVRADDGNVVHARLYRADPTPGAPTRLICWVHGGPTDQWQVTFMPRIAYWR
ncbi:MAG: hypothetical protein AB7L17_21370, partial [Ilumatobacteraceae bacterium]